METKFSRQDDHTVLISNRGCSLHVDLKHTTEEIRDNIKAVLKILQKELRSGRIPCP